MIDRRVFGAGLLPALMLRGDQAIAEVNSVGRGYARLEEFFREGDDPARQDASGAFVRGCNWSAATGKTLVLERRYRMVNPAVVAGKYGVSLHLDNAKIDLEDSTTARLSTLAVGKVGLLFTKCTNLKISGKGLLTGLGPVGVTSLAGLVLDRCQGAVLDAALSFDNMAAGLFMVLSDGAKVARLTSNRMKGSQTFGNGTAGSTLVLQGCHMFEIGSVSGVANAKPVVYLSVSPDEAGRRRDNADGFIGSITGAPDPDSVESSILSLRSARNCRFGTITSHGASLGVYVVRYSSDHGYSVDGNTIGAVKGTFVATGASIDAAVHQEVEDDSLLMGTTHIGSVDAICAGEFGILVSAGALDLGAVTLSGGVRPFAVRGAKVMAKRVTIRNQSQEALTIGQGADLSIDTLNILTGSTGGVTGAVRYLPELGGKGGLGNVRFGVISYAGNGVGVDVQYVYFDYSGKNGPDKVRIGKIEGRGQKGQAYFADLIGGKTVSFSNGFAEVQGE